MTEDFPRCKGKCQRPLPEHQLEDGYCKFCATSRPDPFMPKELSPMLQAYELEMRER
jgi:hypothetical protein